MSLDLLRIVPEEIGFIPSTIDENRINHIIKELLPKSEEVEIDMYDEIRFIDQGENFEFFICPSCKKEFNIFNPNLEDWGLDWAEKMESVNILSESIRMQCCNSVVNITEIQYHWPAYFAAFEICIHYPNISRNLTQAELSRIENELQCKMRQVRTHY